MLRQEKFGAGLSDQKNLDAQFAKAIMGDGKFQNDLDYMDENVEKLSRQKMRSDAMKRQFAINGTLSSSRCTSTEPYGSRAQTIRRRNKFCRHVISVLGKMIHHPRRQSWQWEQEPTSHVLRTTNWSKVNALLCLYSII